MVDQNARLEAARERALVISLHIRQRADLGIREGILEYDSPLDFEERLEDLAVAPEAWEHIIQSGIEPRLVFAHPDLLRAIPQASLHYRGIGLLSLKRMQQLKSSVNRWEAGSMRRPPDLARCLKVARTYNAVISVVITGADGWTLENGYRNILATIGITEDGALRNIVGQEGEAAVKTRIAEWLSNSDDIVSEFRGATTLLGESQEFRMTYGSEPDICFERLNQSGNWQIVSTVEIKSGADPAAALERLGAIQKSFDQTDARARNFAVLGVVTPEMRRRLNQMNVARDFLLYEIMHSEEAWDDFINEIFHHTLRIV